MAVSCFHRLPFGAAADNDPETTAEPFVQGMDADRDLYHQIKATCQWVLGA